MRSYKVASTRASGGNNSGKGVNLLVMVLVVSMLLHCGGGGDVADVYGDSVRDIRLSKKNRLGSDDRCMLLPLNL